MSVSSRVVVGLTLQFKGKLSTADWRKIHAMEEKYPELDEYSYNYKDRAGKLLLISDGMNGEFCRLIKVDKYVDGKSLREANEFVELNMPEGVLNQELISRMSELYKEFTGEYPKNTDFKYAMWSQTY